VNYFNAYKKGYMIAEEILRALPFYYYVIDLKKKKIIQTNDPNVKMENEPCFMQLFQKKKPCMEVNGECLCQQMPENDSVSSFILENFENETQKYFKSEVRKLSGDLVVATFSDITNETVSAKEMKINTRRMERAEKLASFGSWEIDLQTNMINGTNGSAEIYGLEKRSMPLEELRKISLPEFRETLNKALENLIAGKEPYNVHYKIKRPKDGQVRHIHGIAEYRADKKMIFGVANDVTEIVNSQSALHESLTDLRLAQKIAQIGNWKFDPENKELQWSDQALDIFELNEIPVDFGIKDFEHYTGKAHFSRLKKAIQTAINQGKPFEHQVKIKAGNEKVKWIEIICRPDNEKGPSGYFLRGTIQDITSSKTVENELSKTNILLNTLIQNLPDAIYMKDIQYRKVIANKGDVLNCGKKEMEEVIGKTDFDIFPKEIAAKFFEDDKQVIEHGRTVVDRGEELPGNPKRWIRTTKVPLRNSNDQIIGLVGIGHDITLWKQMMEELESAKQKAEESDQLKSLFLANMSHEIRTPLNALLGFSNIICSANIEKEKVEYFGKIIESSGQRLTSVIDDILDISLIQSNQLKLEYAFFSLNELLEEMFVLYKIQEAPKIEKIDFKVHFCEIPEKEVVCSDKTRITQILHNLLDNAFKFTEEGFIEFGCLTSNEDELVLFVKDSGIGIEADNTKVIFESFRQAQEGMSRLYDGTGLGLSIVSGIVQRLGGEVWVKSEKGVGSCFYVSVPREIKEKSVEKEYGKTI
jgi:PAS domain S-box-containing protein